jgi:beta-phosphoglucomutase-like phosphatase (HAD superfamily)
MQNDVKSGHPSADWGVIFDVDGTMVDNAEYHRAAWIQLGAQYGKSITSQFYREHIHAHTNDSIVRTLFGNVSGEMIAKISNEKEIAGLSDLLKALKCKAVLCAAASGFKASNNAQMPYIAITAGADSHILEFIAGHVQYKDFTTITPADLKKLLG